MRLSMDVLVYFSLTFGIAAGAIVFALLMLKDTRDAERRRADWMQQEVQRIQRLQIDMSRKYGGF